MTFRHISAATTNSWYLVQIVLCILKSLTRLQHWNGGVACDVWWCLAHDSTVSNTVITWAMAVCNVYLQWHCTVIKCLLRIHCWHQVWRIHTHVHCKVCMQQALWSLVTPLIVYTAFDNILYIRHSPTWRWLGDSGSTCKLSVQAVANWNSHGV